VMRAAVAICVLAAAADGAAQLRRADPLQPELSLARHRGNATKGCYDTVEGEPCYKAIQWAMKKGAWKNPEWYVDVKNPLDEGEMQYYFYKNNKHDCMKPCRSDIGTKEEQTHAAETDSHEKKGAKKDWRSYFS